MFVSHKQRTMRQQRTDRILIPKRDENREQKFCKLHAHRFRCEAHKPVDPYFIAATVANIKYLALIFKYSNLFRERVKITTCPFFFSLAALNYGHGRIVPGEMQIEVHSPLQFVTSFRTDFVQFIVEDDEDIRTR